MIRHRQFCVLMIVLVFTFPLSVSTSFGQDLTKIPVPLINLSVDLGAYNEMIEAAKCILPLSQNPDLDPKFGTRHRAALGLSEETDAVIVVISEETGKISIAFEGKFYPELDFNKLRERLNEFVKVTTGV